MSRGIKIATSFQIAGTFLWIGFVCAISFMEAWLKFEAPGITLEQGLAVGKLVFAALNKVEWLFALVILVAVFIANGIKRRRNFFYLIPILVLVVQTFWLLPALSERATAIIQGGSSASANLHFYYVFAEILKVLALFLFGIKIFRTYE